MNVLETERLHLRWLTLDDAAFLLELMNDPAFIQNVADRGLRTPDDAAGYITQKFLPHYQEHSFGPNAVVLKATGQPIGTCGLFKRETMEHVDLGYAFLREFWGQGFAYEAAAAVMAHGRDVLQIPKIVAMTAPANESSIKLLEKLGLRFERMIQMPGYESESKLFV